MPTNNYDALKKHYRYDNFDKIVETLTDHFPNLFNLALLNEEVEQGRLDGSYVAFFSECMTHLGKQLYTQPEIIDKMYKLLLKNDGIRNHFLEKLIFVPQSVNFPAPQLSFMEKLATNTFKVAEPVTYIDMLRVVNNLIGFKKQADRFARIKPVGVFNLDSLQKSFDQLVADDYQAIMINCNRDITGVPKWAVVNLKTATPQVYCETPLFEPEKEALEKKLGTHFDIATSTNADSLPSTGYSAIAWLDQHFLHAWHFDTDADFNALLGQYCLLQFRGDDREGIQYSCTGNEYQHFVSPEVKHIADYDEHYEQLAGLRFTHFAMASMLKKVEGETFAANDITGLIRIAGNKQWTSMQVDGIVAKAFRTNLPGLCATMLRLNLLQETADTSTLTIPQNLSIDTLRNTYNTICNETRTNHKLYRYLSRINLEPVPAEDAACSMVMALLRTKSKKRNIKIVLPQTIQLNADETTHAISFLQENAYVTEFDHGNNTSLKAVHAASKTILARNRWLMAKGYCPPLLDDYWYRAARYWLIHLSQQTDLLQNKERHQFFKRCVEEMSLQGLQSLLRLLQDEMSRDFIDSIFGKNRPAFYAACEPSDLKQYIQELTAHLNHDGFFPFSEIGLPFGPSQTNTYIQLIDSMNRQDCCERIVFLDALKYPTQLPNFLITLTEKALEKGWVGTISFPELEAKNITEALRELRAAYDNLNNIILRNRHRKNANVVIANINKVTSFEVEALPLADAPVANADAAKPKTLEFNGFDHLKDQAWPLQRSGVVQLQLQQQQQLEQSRQVEREQHKIVQRLIEEPLPSDRVGYDNIDALLGEFYKKLEEEGAIDISYAPLKKDSETALQGFFRTWINAKPKVDAPEVIRSFTLDAAKVMLSHPERFTSGLSLTNLPQGFFTQRLKDGSLILCYKPELGFVCGSNPLTVPILIQKPQPQDWEGDFRLLDEKRYLKPIARLDETDAEYMALFANLQPQKCHQAAFKAFCQQNPQLMQLIKGHEDKITKHWLVFFQSWKIKGKLGVQAFLDWPLELLESPKVYDLLFKELSPELQAWIKGHFTTPQTLRALGQVYYRFGSEGMVLLLQKFKQMEQVLGKEFFTAFQNTILAATKNYDCFMKPSLFETMDLMMKRLRPTKALAIKKAALDIVKNHLESVSWENLDTLWRAFDYFLSEITDLGLELNGDEFADLSPQNMMVGLDRILESLRQLPLHEEKARFLRSLSKLQVNGGLLHGGVHYAIQYEGFRYFDESLKLADFEEGTPTYAPQLVNIFDWNGDGAKLNLLRSLASCSKFSHENRQQLTQVLGAADLEAKNKLLWLLNCHYPANKLEDSLDIITGLDPAFVGKVALWLHKAVYVNHKKPEVSLQSLSKLAEEVSKNPGLSTRLDNVMTRFPEATILEVLTIIDQNKTWATEFEKTMALFESPLTKPASISQDLFQNIYKLSVLLGHAVSTQVDELIDLIEPTSAVVKQELGLLFEQLLSIDYEQSEAALPLLGTPPVWNALTSLVGQMQASRATTGEIRLGFLNSLGEQGLHFKYSKSGAFRTLKEEDKPQEIGFFVDHQTRLWNFLVEHIAISSKVEAKDALMPILRVFKRLQLNHTYLNEVEPLLAMLEESIAGKYWTADYFADLLKALQSADEQSPFPIAFVKTLVHDKVECGPKLIDDLSLGFPKTFANTLQAVLKNTIFSKDDQIKLCELALKEYGFTHDNKQLMNTLTLLSPPEREASRSQVLDTLLMATDQASLETRLDRVTCLLQQATPAGVVKENWGKVSVLWLKAMADNDREAALFANIRRLGVSEEQRALLFHIMAFSSLRPGLRDKDDYLAELEHSAAKLLDRLQSVSTEDLQSLAACYPRQPAPGTKDVLKILKAQHKKQIPIAEAILDYTCKPHSTPRMDYGLLCKTREADLQRMMRETWLSQDGQKVPMSASQTARVSMIFSKLKHLQAGLSFIDGFQKPLDAMNRNELRQAFKDLSLKAKDDPENDHLQAQIWAVLFQGLGHTMRKYPHLAQQFALIANDICVDAHTRVLQLATGEGKSHFVALRAIKHAGMGKIVDICTAKRSLAERDAETYQDFFSFFDTKSSYIHPGSKHEEYTDTQIHYTIAGDLSLFLDEQQFIGRPITCDRNNRVGLFDEYDFIRFDEGRKTEYNYARPTGKTPKQMNWFYQSMNTFYEENSAELNAGDRKITKAILDKAAKKLLQDANGDEDKQNYVHNLIRDHLQLVRWIQAAHEAHHLEQGVGFTVVSQITKIGDARYPLQEIIPVSSDNQKMIGSTFSGGVHELLAVLMNTKAKAEGKPQNFHVHPESNLLSSQVASQMMHELWGSIEGFTGTISASQGALQGCQVLGVPTNQTDRRQWVKPNFYDAADERLEAVVGQIRECLFKEKGSILFACKNDKEVLNLKQALKDKFTEEECKQFIFYTNEDKETPEEIIEDKKTKEQWKNGQKEKATALIASGFGRGDNVGVENVFLFDATDNNDKVQKAGRTGRNGAAGKVFQFYLRPQFQQEEALLKQQVDRLTRGATPIDALLAEAAGTSADEKCFERVMLLREYLFGLDTIANQAYHESLAQFTSWGMKLKGQISDPVQSMSFANVLTVIIKTMEKQWVSISNANHAPLDEQIGNLHGYMHKQAFEITELYRKLKPDAQDVLAFAIKPVTVKSMPLIPSQAVANDPKIKFIANIGVLLARIPHTPEDKAFQQAIPGLLQQLAANTRALHFFYLRIIRCKTLAEFHASLQGSVDRLVHNGATPNLNALEEVEYAALTPDESLLRDTTPELHQAFRLHLQSLHPTVAENLLREVLKESVFLKNTRLETAATLMPYLAQFSREENEQACVQAYVQDFDELMFYDPKMLKAFFSSKTKLPLKYARSLLNILANSVESTEADNLAQLLQEAIAKNPDQRLRELSRLEILANTLPAKEGTTLLANVAKIMTKIDDKDWQDFQNLVSKTEAYWHKDAEGRNQADLQELWARLAESANPNLLSHLKHSFTLQGKQWFLYLSNLLATPTLTGPAFDLYQTICEDIVPSSELSRAVKTKLLKNIRLGLSQCKTLPSVELLKNVIGLCLPEGDFINTLLAAETDLSALCALLNQLKGSHSTAFLLKNSMQAQHDINTSLKLWRMTASLGLPANALTACSAMLASLRSLTVNEPSLFDRLLALPDKTCHALLLTLIEQPLPPTNPKVLDLLLGFAEQTANATATKNLCDLSLQLMAEERILNTDTLLDIKNKVSRFITADISVLAWLKQLIKQNPALRNIILTNNTAQYLSEHTQDETRNQVNTMIDLFYQRVLQHRGLPNLMFDLQDPTFAAMFDFSNKNKERHNQRLIWMHLLHHDAFVTTVKDPYPWSQTENQALLQKGFDCYIKEAANILESDKPPMDTDAARDLSLTQQQAFLKLSNELGMIGKPKLKLPETTQTIEDMKVSLGTLIGNYKSSWFKTQARKTRIEALETRLTNAMTNATQETNYQRVFEALHKEHVAAVEEDARLNKTRFLKLHRGGQSRYLNTLNQMQDMVIRHWVSDPLALPSFQAYEQLVLTDFFDDMTNLQNAVFEKTEENKLGFSKAHGMQKIYNLFLSKTTIKKHEDLLKAITKFTTTNNPATMSKDDLENILTELRTNYDCLPGHVQTLVDQVLIRGDTMVSYKDLMEERSAAAVLQ